VGNDPLILSGTPFLAYLTHHTGLHYEPWVFSEFMAANTASAVLVSSNPTNILITGSFGLNFITGFTQWTILPSVIPAILNYGVILLMFRKSIPKTIVPLQDDPWTKLRDRTGAIFLTVLMLVTVAVLVGTSFVPRHAVEVWMVTGPAGVLGFLYNIISDLRDRKLRKAKLLEQEGDPAATFGPLDRTGSSISRQSPIRRRSSQPPQISSEKPTNSTESQPTDLSDTNKETCLSPSSSLKTPKATKTTSEAPSLASLITRLTARFPSTTATLTRLPIPLLPFAMCFFILVRGLSQRGWIHVWAVWYRHICTNPAGTIFFTGFLCAAVLCPLAGTNIGATIILVEIIRDPAFARSEAVLRDERVMLGAIYAVALGSNLGAFSFTFAGSLAGLLWRGLLRDAKVGGGHDDRSDIVSGQDADGENGTNKNSARKSERHSEKKEGQGIEVSQWRFARVNFWPLILQMGVACAIILGEVYWFA
jgi:Na+/H+ antiporter NhaD/arsenite permease-like protein